jgi:uncharacterized cofD-like protein
MQTFETEPVYNIVIAGGGTGTATLADGLGESLARDGINVQVDTVVSVYDNGGSTGGLRELTGYPGMGDGAKCLSAFCRYPGVREILDTRYGVKGNGRDHTTDDVRHDAERFMTAVSTLNPAADEDRTAELLNETVDTASQLPGISGHTFRNLLVTAAITKNDRKVDAAFLEIGRLLGNTGRVIPVSNDTADLVLYDGEVVHSEGAIDEREIHNSQNARVWLEPDTEMSESAESAFRNADILLLGPGSVFTSQLPILLTGGVDRALREMRGTLVGLNNLETQDRETKGWKLSDFLRKITQYTHGRQLDYIICHDPNARPAFPSLAAPIVLDIPKLTEFMKEDVVISADLVRREHVDSGSPNDSISHLRSYLHHDPAVVARVLKDRILPAQPPVKKSLARLASL